MKTSAPWLALALVVALLAVFARPAAAQDDDDTAPPVRSSRLTVVNDHAVLTFDAQTLAAAGVRTAQLRATVSRPQVSAPATVISALDLVTARAQYVATQAALAKAQAATTVAQQEYERLQRLNAQQNASQKDVEAALGTLRASQADVAADQQSLQLQLAAVRQSWGGVVANWVGAGAAPLEALMQQRMVLVQVTLPASAGPGLTGAWPATVPLETAPSNAETASLISSFPRVDARVQGVSALYQIAMRPGLAPGLNLQAMIPEGRPQRGVLIPASAVVWWQGSAWVYLRLAHGQSVKGDQFERRLVPSAAAPIAGGLFAAAGFSPGQTVVTQGAQIMLSEEMRDQIQTDD